MRPRPRLAPALALALLAGLAAPAARAQTAQDVPEQRAPLPGQLPEPPAPHLPTLSDGRPRVDRGGNPTTITTAGVNDGVRLPPANAATPVEVGRPQADTPGGPRAGGAGGAGVSPQGTGGQGTAPSAAPDAAPAAGPATGSGQR